MTLTYLNGEFIPFDTARLPLHDAGFVYGATVVDNARTFRRELFRWPDHLARFRRDCARCYVPLEKSDEEITLAARKLIEHNGDLLPAGGELQLVTFATPGPLGFYVGETRNGPPTFGMATYPLPFSRYRRFFTEGVTLAIVGTQGTDPDDLLPPSVKHRSRLPWYLAERLARDPASPRSVPGAVPVILNQQGVGDTAIGSVLAVVEGTVVLPVPGTVLESISAKVVAELCAAIGLPCREAQLDLRSFAVFGAGHSFRVSELMLAGTGFCLAGVKRVVDGQRTQEFEWPGPVFQKLLAAWSAMVNLDVSGQFREEKSS